MGEGNRILLGLLLFSFAFSSFQLLSASNDDADDAIFYESFDEDFEGRWIVSDKGDYQGIFRNQELQHRFWSFLKIKDVVFRCLSTKSFFIVCPIDNCEKGFGEQAMEDLVFDFQELGSGAAIPSAWKHAKSEGHDDYGLLVSEQARKYAIVKELDAPVSLKDGTVVLQFETRLQKGLECGGAYLKYLRTQEAGWKPKEFDNEAPYSIMFGPDKCGATNKVHFILKHKNPKSGEYVEHHLKDTPSVPLDKLSHVYTAILKPDNELQILIDGEEKKKANFLSSEDFEPPLIPSKTIPDPDDTKPEDWDERAKIPDPDAVKPEDWDEDAPFEIEDEEAEKPEGWLDDEPEEIDDPDATKPEDWDDEEDGEWEAPKIDNPKCEAAPGCGEWKRPTKKNPAYKGKWSAPYIDNPAYKGIWKPQEIPNPNYFELEKPDFEPIAAIGIEIWTMQDGILFDNILIATDDKIAASYRETTWKPKFTIEKEKQKAEELAATSSDGLAGFQKKIFDLLYKIADIPFLSDHKLKIIDIIEKGEKQPNITIGILVSVVVVFLTIFFRLVFGGKKPARVVEKTNTGRTETSTNQAGEENEENKEKEETSAAPRRRTRREN